MTALAFADMVRAHRTGPGRWHARCPAHEDSSPSLSIAEGTDGRVLVRCWAGCDAEDVLAAQGLRMCDLFSGSPLPPQRIAEINRERSIALAIERAQDRAMSARNRRLRDLETLRGRLGSVLVDNPDDPEVASAFSSTLDKLAELESNASHYEDGPIRYQLSPEPLSWIANELQQIFTSEQIQNPKENAARKAT